MTIVMVFLSISLGYASSLLDPLRVFIERYPSEFRPWSFEQEDGAPENHPWLYMDDQQYVSDFHTATDAIRQLFKDLSGESLAHYDNLPVTLDDVVYCELFYHEELIYQMKGLITDVTNRGFHEGSDQIFANLYQFMRFYPGLRARTGVPLFRGPLTVANVHDRLNAVLTRTEFVLTRSQSPNLDDVVRQLLSVYNSPRYYLEVLSAQISFMLARILYALQGTSLDYLTAPVHARFREFTGAFSVNHELASMVQFNDVMRENALQLWDRAFTIIRLKQTSRISNLAIAEFAEPYLRSYLLWFNIVSPGPVDIYCRTISANADLISILSRTWRQKNFRYGDFWVHAADNIRTVCPQVVIS